MYEFSYLNEPILTWWCFKELHHPAITKQPLIHILSRVFAVFWGIALITTSCQLLFTLILEITSSRRDNAVQFTTYKPLLNMRCIEWTCQCVDSMVVHASMFPWRFRHHCILPDWASGGSLKAVYVMICCNLHHSIFYWPYVSTWKIKPSFSFSVAWQACGRFV